MENGTQSIRRIVALATAITALAAPVAVAAPVEQILSENAGSTMGNAQATTPQDPYSLFNRVPDTPVSSPSPTPVSSPSEGGFDWADAGIGATVVLALAAMVGGAALVLRTRPQRGSVA